nr:inorganic pyrophosphatase-like isoform X1 [Dermatophagoides farinae]XP_046916628.1 inorganic pyrophosphatase-like isoform X1 [Dermatophagoides farinae]
MEKMSIRSIQLLLPSLLTRKLTTGSVVPIIGFNIHNNNYIYASFKHQYHHLSSSSSSSASSSFSLSINQFSITKSIYYKRQPYFIGNKVHFVQNHRLRTLVTNKSNYKMSTTNYSVDHRGSFNSLDYRIYFKDNSNGKIISPWHDIPLFVDKSAKHYNMVVEIPRWTNEKMEIATAEPMSPIKQDIKKGALRYVKNVFPHKGYIWNYGAFPQTWENPNHIDQDTKTKGDNDPIDVIEIGSRVAKRGDVVPVKILGTIALIDEGETDWKIIAIDTRDELASQMNNVDDVEKLLPGLLRATVEWFKIYKIPDGKPANKFAFNGEAKDREFAEKIVEETHQYWQEMMENKSGEHKLDLKNVTLGNSFSINDEQAKQFLETRPSSDAVEPTPIADQVAIDKWHHVKLI